MLRSGVLASVVVASTWAGTVVSTLPVGAQAAVPPAQVVNNPPVAPHQILVFPQRDFISAAGYAADDRVIVTVTHPNGTTWGTDPSAPVVPQPDPRAADGAPFAGIVEVNHPGGACWFQTTPDIRPFDKVRISIVGGPNAGQADETTVSNVTAQRPVEVNPSTVQIHGTAADALGNQIDPTLLEQRLVAGRDLFLLNGRRTLRATSAAGNDGSLAYDSPTSTSWTATYSGLQAADVTRALGAESRILWLGVGGAGAIEGTVYENGAAVIAGPATPGCTAALEKLPPPPGSELIPPSTPTNLTAAVSNNNTVSLAWSPSTDNVGVTSYGVYRDGVALVNVQNLDGNAPAPTSYVDTNVPPGTYMYTVDAADAIGNRSNPSVGANVTTALQLATLPPGVTINEPPVAPVQIISFPSRDFTSNSGFLPTDTVAVQVLRHVDGQSGLVLVSSATQIPQPDPRAAPNDPFAGIVEVNHPGGVCWDGVTPDIRVNDVLRTIAYNPDGSIRTVDQTTTANAVAERPTLVTEASSGAANGVVQVKGLAMYHDGRPMDLAQFENRLIANRDLFVFNGRRVIRAGGAGKDGSLVYDPADPSLTHWIATYSGLTAQDMDRIIGRNGFPGAESRALWLGAQPLAGLELTIYENSADPIGGGTVNGPSAGVCFAPSEPFDTSPPVAPRLDSATQASSNSVQVSWTPTTDNVAVYQYAVNEDGKRVRTVAASTTSVTLQNVSAGSHTYTVDAVDAASPQQQLAAVPTYSTPWGNRSSVSNPVTLGQPDVTAPTVPLNLVATAGTGEVNLTWSASQDDVAVVSYGVYRNDNKVADVPQSPTPTYRDRDLVQGTYTYTVDAIDAAGNRSAQAPAVQAIVSQVSDSLAPSVPTNVLAGLPDIHAKGIDVTWTPSTDNVGVTGYGVYRNGTRIADLPASPTPKFSETAAASGTYVYTVDAFDSLGNRSAQSASSTAVVANDPPLAPKSLIAFPQRDFVSNSGFTTAEGPVTAQVLRFTAGRWTLVSTSDPVTPTTDGTGTVEVNHPGGGCWIGVTPDIRPGDIIRTITAQGVADQTTVPSVAAFRPILKKAPSRGQSDGIVEVHGIAFTRTNVGTVVPIDPGAFESRLIANRDAFDFNARRAARAGGAGTDGTLKMDAPGSINWTATYTGIDAVDAARALGGAASGLNFVGAESRAVWLGRNPAGLTELTIYENGDGVLGGPVGAPCTAPQEPTGLSTPNVASLTFGDQVTNSSSASQTVTLTNSGNAPLHVTSMALSGYNPTEFSLGGSPSASSCTNTTLAPLAQCAVAVTFSPLTAGSKQANLEFLDDAGNTPGLVTLGGEAIKSTVPTVATITAPPVASLQTGLLTLNPTLAQNRMPVTVTWDGAYETAQLQVSTNGGAFVNTDVQPPSSTPNQAAAPTVTVNLPMGTGTTTYAFQVRGCVGVSCTTYTVGPRVTVQPNDNTSGFSYNGSWSGQKVTGAYNQSVQQTTTANVVARLANPVTFTTSSGSFALVASKGANRGKVLVTIDAGTANASTTEVDLYAPTTELAGIVWTRTGLAAGSHTISVTALGTRNPASTGSLVDVDAIIALR